MHQQGQARKPYKFGVKLGIAVTAKQCSIVGARSFAGNPYGGTLWLSSSIRPAR